MSPPNCFRTIRLCQAHSSTAPIAAAAEARSPGRLAADQPIPIRREDPERIFRHPAMETALAARPANKTPRVLDLA